MHDIIKKWIKFYLRKEEHKNGFDLKRLKYKKGTELSRTYRLNKKKSIKATSYPCEAKVEHDQE